MNITLKLDADLAREIRTIAANEGTSISAMLAALLQRLVREHKSYHCAKKRALARLNQGFPLRWTRPHSRDELHRRLKVGDPEKS